MALGAVDSVVDEDPWYATPSIVSMTLLKWGRLRRKTVSLFCRDRGVLLSFASTLELPK